MNISLKKFLTFTITLGLLMLGGVFVAHAADYQLLEPTFGSAVEISGADDFGKLFEKLYQWIFRFAGLAAVLILIYAGILYVFGGFGGPTEGNITKAKGYFWNLTIGGSILLVSYLALKAINTDLVSLTFDDSEEGFPSICQIAKNCAGGGGGGGGSGTPTGDPRSLTGNRLADNGGGVTGDGINRVDFNSTGGETATDPRTGLSSRQTDALEKISANNDFGGVAADDAIRIERIERLNDGRHIVYLSNTEGITNAVVNNWTNYTGSAGELRVGTTYNLAGPGIGLFSNSDYQVTRVERGPERGGGYSWMLQVD